MLFDKSFITKITIASVVAWAAPARALDEVQLVDASSRVTSYRSPEYQTLTADILVKNLGPVKKVGLHYRNADGNWVDAWGAFQYATGDGRERWHVDIVPCNPFAAACAQFDPDFVARMDVNGQSYWDNNGGVNYHLNRQSGYRLANGFKVFALSPGMVTRSLGGSPLLLNGRVLVENLSAVKSVKLVYTENGWQTRAEVPLSFVRTENLYPPERFTNPGEFGGEAWDFSFNPPDAGAVLEYFIQYDVNGQRFFDSNFGRNYKLAIPEHPQLTIRGTTQDFQPQYMYPTAGIDASWFWTGNVYVTGHNPKERFKFDVFGDWAVNYGENDNGGFNRSGIADRNGLDIRFLDGPGPYKITFTNRTHAFDVARQPESGPIRRTLVFMYGRTVPGQDMYLRGGIDHAYSQNVLHKPCADTAGYDNPCSIPHRHRLRWDRNDYMNDFFLDWYGAERNQSPAAVGSPMIWTTSDPNNPKAIWKDTVGYTPLNKYGEHYWMLDVDMDCTRTVNGWFEAKSFISNGPGWENDVTQPGAPYASRNHFGQCGMINVFRRGESAAQIVPF